MKQIKGGKKVLQAPFFAVASRNFSWPTGCTWFSVARYCKQLLQSATQIDIRFCFDTKGGGKKVPKIKPALRGCLTVRVLSLRRPALICLRVKITCDSLIAQFSSETHFPFSPARRRLHSCVTVIQLLVTLADPDGVQPCNVDPCGLRRGAVQC